MPIHEPYFAADGVTLYLGDMREVVPAAGIKADCIVTDPPYGETSLAWDRWPIGWPAVAAAATRSMWCFGSLRMFMSQQTQFMSWKLSQDVVWQKTTGSSPVADRFKRVHEIAAHWYHGAWREVYHQTPRIPASAEAIKRNGSAARTNGRGQHLGTYDTRQRWVDTGMRLMQSVIRIPGTRGNAIHPTEKPVDILGPLIEYACPVGGTVLDPFAGSGATAVAARATGRSAVLVEADERYCEAIAKRLSQGASDLVSGVTRPLPPAVDR